MNLPEIQFTDADTDKVKQAIVTGYETVSGRSLAAGDPIRLFLEAIAAIIVQLLDSINQTGKMNLLAYAIGNYLDHIGILTDTERIEASAATTTVRFTLSAAQTSAVTIPKGTRVTNEDMKIYFATNKVLTIPVGDTSGTVESTCTETGASGNGYVAGQLTKLVDPVAYVESVANTTTSAGGDDEEDDDAFRERIRISPEKYSVAGPYGAYEYWAKTASTLIEDVTVLGPESKKVNDGEVYVYPLLSGGELPDDEILTKVSNVLNDEKIRPLTDHVYVKKPTAVSYDLTVTYYVSKSNKEQSSAIQAAVSSAIDAYVLWQKSELGRDIDPSKLVQMIVDAGGVKVNVTSPAVTTIDDDSVAICNTKTVTFGGVVDD